MHSLTTVRCDSQRSTLSCDTEEIQKCQAGTDSILDIQNTQLGYLKFSLCYEKQCESI